VRRLSNKELEILSLSAQGMTAQDIATHTDRSLSTIKSQKSRIIAKLQVRNFNEAIYTTVHQIAAWRDGRPRRNGQDD